ncbi:Rha family transcriptional regulator [Xanthomonas campestris]|nr:Rha family transcriptional regulator [Xanthomonas campestris]
MIPVITAGDAPAITSRDIAELIDSRHDNVKQSIERLVQRGVIVQPPLGDEPSTDAMGRSRPTQVYVFAGVQGKRDSIVVVAQLSPEFTAHLVDRWQELERRLAAPADPLALPPPAISNAYSTN